MLLMFFFCLFQKGRLTKHPWVSQVTANDAGSVNVRNRQLLEIAGCYAPKQNAKRFVMLVLCFFVFFESSFCGLCRL